MSVHFNEAKFLSSLMTLCDEHGITLIRSAPSVVKRPRKAGM